MPKLQHQNVVTKLQHQNGHPSHWHQNVTQVTASEVVYVTYNITGWYVDHQDMWVGHQDM